MENKKETHKIVYVEPADYFPEETRKKYKLGEYAESEELKRIKAVMIGHAVGDALGVPVEFCSREELDENPVTDMMGFGSYPVPEGCWSDDTSMSLATLDSLKKDKIDYDDIMDNFVAWCSRDEYTPTGEMFDIGRTCLTAIRNYLRTDGKPALDCGLSEEHSNGNGSLMRIHPMVLYLYYKGYDIEDAIEIIHNTSSITHAHMRSKMACGIYTCILWELLKEPSKASVLKGLNRARRYYGGHLSQKEKSRIKERLQNPTLTDNEKSELLEMLYVGIDIKTNKLNSDEFSIYDRMLLKRIGWIYRHWEDIDDHKEVTRDEIKSTGYVVDTLEAAVWCVLTTYSYKECVLKAVNLGEDTDTVAAVAGGLAGAMYGFDKLPIEWVEKIKKLDYIESLCEDAYANWQKKND